jgi:hypothetical protein
MLELPVREGNFFWGVQKCETCGKQYMERNAKSYSFQLQMDDKMVELASKQRGFLGIESVRNKGEIGITEL